MYICILNRGFIWRKQMKFQTPFSSKPFHTNHTKYFNCLSWKYRITPPHTQLTLEYTADTQAQPCWGSLLFQSPVTNFSPLLWSLWQSTAVFFSLFLRTDPSLNSCVCLQDLKWTQDTHAWSSRVFLLASPPPDYTMYSALRSNYNLPLVWAKRVGREKVAM